MSGPNNIVRFRNTKWPRPMRIEVDVEAVQTTIDLVEFIEDELWRLFGHTGDDGFTTNYGNAGFTYHPPPDGDW